VRRARRLWGLHGVKVLVVLIWHVLLLELIWAGH